MYAMRIFAGPEPWSPFGLNGADDYGRVTSCAGPYVRATMPRMNHPNHTRHSSRRELKARQKSEWLFFESHHGSRPASCSENWDLSCPQWKHVHCGIILVQHSSHGGDIAVTGDRLTVPRRQGDEVQVSGGLLGWDCTGLGPS